MGLDDMYLHLASFPPPKAAEARPCCDVGQQFIPFHCGLVLSVRMYHIQFGAIPDTEALNICIRVLVWIYVFIPLGQVPRSRTVESLGKSMFYFLKTWPKCLPNGHPISQTY